MAAPSVKSVKKARDGKIHANMLFVSGLPYTTTSETLGEIFSEIGPVKNCFVVKDKDSSTNKGFGYVKFSLFKDAEKAISQIKMVDGRRVTLTFADSKRKIKRPRRSTTKILDDLLLQNADDKEEVEVESKSEEEILPKQMPKEKEKAFVKDSSRKRKPQKSQVPKARLVIRNLHFACDARTLQCKFEKFGRINDVHIVKKADSGGSLGVAFVQFTKLTEASAAMEGVNGTKILGRVVAVDWAVDKETYTSSLATQEVHEEPSDDEQEEMEESEETSDNEDEESEDLDDDIEEQNEEEEDDIEEEAPPIKKPALSHPSDVRQGRTLFVRNLPFDAQDEELEDLFCDFGDTSYCVIVRDKVTLMCKGSAFVQFRSKDNASNCLKKCNTEGGTLIMNGRRLVVSMALEKGGVADVKATAVSGTEKSERRNIHLLREGMIREGSQQAEDLSKADLLLRTKIEAQMKAKLKNPAIFISPTRLVVNNLPYTVNDAALKTEMTKAAGGKGVKITECRVMRHLTQVNSAGVARSQGYAFVEFTDPTHAMAALHTANNNDLFEQKKKLIVHFSLENRNVLEFKRKRQLKSSMKHDSNTKGKTKTERTNRIPQPQQSLPNPTNPVKGQKTKPKNVFPSHSGPKIRHKPRNTQQKNKKLKPSTVKPPPKVRPQDNITKKRPSKKRKEFRDSFDSLVLKYKKKLTNKAE